MEHDDELRWITCSCGNKIGVPHSAWQGRIDGYAKGVADERKRAAERLERAPYKPSGFLKLDVLQIIMGGDDLGKL
jgi:hypothetical protein